MVTYSAVQGGYDGPGNIDYNPVFDLEYRILPGSPAIDAGDPSPAFIDVSFPPSRGTARNDMGFLGGPQAALWAETSYTEPQEAFRV